MVLLKCSVRMGRPQAKCVASAFEIERTKRQKVIIREYSWQVILIHGRIISSYTKNYRLIDYIRNAHHKQLQEQGKNMEFIRYLAMNALSIFHTPTFFEGSYFVDDYLSLYHYINYILSYHELPNVYESINFRYTDYDSNHQNTQPYQCKKIPRDMNIEHAANILLIQ